MSTKVLDVVQAGVVTGDDLPSYFLYREKNQFWPFLP